VVYIDVRVRNKHRTNYVTHGVSACDTEHDGERGRFPFFAQNTGLSNKNKKEGTETVCGMPIIDTV
jgi:hypothetical protein